MISQSLYNLADHITGYQVHNRQMEPERWAQLANVLMDLARQAAMLECQPILAGRPDVGPPAERDDG